MNINPSKSGRPKYPALAALAVAAVAASCGQPLQRTGGKVPAPESRLSDEYDESQMLMGSMIPFRSASEAGEGPSDQAPRQRTPGVRSIKPQVGKGDER